MITNYSQQDATFLEFIYFYRRSTCFRRFLRPSSGAHNSGWWAVETPETCRASVKINKFKKRCILLAVIWNYIMMHGHKNIKKKGFPLRTTQKDPSNRWNLVSCTASLVDWYTRPLTTCDHHVVVKRRAPIIRWQQVICKENGDLNRTVASGPTTFTA